MSNAGRRALPALDRCALLLSKGLVHNMLSVVCDRRRGHTIYTDTIYYVLLLAHILELDA